MRIFLFYLILIDQAPARIVYSACFAPFQVRPSYICVALIELPLYNLNGLYYVCHDISFSKAHQQLHPTQFWCRIFSFQISRTVADDGLFLPSLKCLASR